MIERPAPTMAGLMAGRRALVLGAGGGIGAAVVTAFRAAGAAVVAADVAVAPETILCDVTDERSVVDAFTLAEREGPLSDVVHAAGTLLIGPVADMDLADWRAVLDSNLTGAFLVGRECARRLGPGSTVTFVASQAGLTAAANWGAYAASKAGVIRLAEALAQELGPAGTRVNAICPGSVDTPMLTRSIQRITELDHRSPAEVGAQYRAGIPLGRWAHPSEVGNACVALASPLMSYVSGAVLVVDGGELSG